MSLIYFNIITLFISILIIEFLKKNKNFLIIYDYPDNIRKIHKRPIPLIGGPIIFIHQFILLGFMLLSFNYKLKLVIILFLLFFIFFLIGFLDDKNSISPLKKTILIFSILFIVLPIDQNLVVKNLEFKDIEINILLNQGSIFFTIFCFYFFFNLLNFSDGINGLTVLISIFWVIIFIIFSKFNFFYLISFLICLFIVLVYNLKNDLFLGNSGSALLSVILSCLFISEYNNNKTLLCDEIFLLMFVPAIDAGRVSIERAMRGQSPFKADNIHLHHLLLNKLSHIYTLIVYIALTILPFIISSFGLKTYYAFVISLALYILIIIYFKKNSL